MPDKEYLIEFYAVGNSVKVTALDPESDIEVSIIGALGTPRHQLMEVAVRKLEYMMRKKGIKSEEP